MLMTEVFRINEGPDSITLTRDEAMVLYHALYNYRQDPKSKMVKDAGKVEDVFNRLAQFIYPEE